MKKSEKQVLAVGAGVAALAAAATGVYFMTGKNAKNRKKVASWAVKMQKDVVAQLKSAEKASKATYDSIVDNVANTYKGAKNISALELAATAAEMKNHWTAIKSEMDAAAATVKRVAPRRGAAGKAPAKKVTAKKVVTKKAAAKKAPAKKKR